MSELKLVCLRHNDYQGRAYLPEWAAAQGHRWENLLVPRLRAFPPIDSYDAMIVVGGPMSVWETDKHSWLVPEKDYLGKVLAADKPVLGICLGAQLMAELLGSRVFAGPHREIGWFQIETEPASRGTWLEDALPDRYESFFWHGDSFDHPTDAVPLARSAAYPNQGFLWRRCAALQFHLEVTPEWVRMLCERDADQLVDAPHIQSAAQILGKGPDLYRRNNTLMDALLDRWLLDTHRPGGAS